jgi:hypothetical protein
MHQLEMHASTLTNMQLSQGMQNKLLTHPFLCLPWPADCTGAAAGPILSHDGKVIRLPNLAASCAPARAKLLTLIRADQELLLRWYGHPRVRSINLHLYKYLRACLLVDVADLLKEMAEAKGGKDWEAMTAEEALSALKLVLRALLQVWQQQAEYMVVWRTFHLQELATSTPCVAWMLGLAPRLVPQGTAAVRVARLLEAVKKDPECFINASRGDGVWSVAAMGQLIKRAPAAAMMQQGDVHTCAVIAHTGKKEDVCTAAAVLLTGAAAHLDGLYLEGLTVGEAVAAAAQLGRVDAGALLLQQQDYMKRVGSRYRLLENRLLQVVRRCPPDSLPQFDGEEAQEEAQPSSNVAGPAMQGLAMAAH